jgi:hypothetical protein
LIEYNVLKNVSSAQQNKKYAKQTMILMVLRLALLLFSEGTSRSLTSQPFDQPTSNPGLLNSTLALMPPQGHHHWTPFCLSVKQDFEKKKPPTYKYHLHPDPHPQRQRPRIPTLQLLQAANRRSD